MRKIGFCISALFLSFILISCGAGSSAGDLSIQDLSVNSNEAISNEATSNEDSTAEDQSSTSSNSITISWTKPGLYEDQTLFNDLAGYRVYYKEKTDNSDITPRPEQLELLRDIDINEIGLSHFNQFTIEFDENLKAGTTYYFGMTAYNSIDIQSEMSNIVEKKL